MVVVDVHSGDWAAVNEGEVVVLEEFCDRLGGNNHHGMVFMAPSLIHKTSP